ncbi:MAG: hypothetical protein FWG66_07335 [Spirochaetes bacterium]|nr:hypothetical protein [Spirochaetota bacterium]
MSYANKSLGGFALRLQARCGTPLLAGVLCRAGFERQSRRDILSLYALEFSAGESIYDIDYKLAQAVKKHCGEYICAAGVSACLPWAQNRTGGIIGSPHLEVASADGRLEPIGESLFLQTFPGGPGYVALCHEKTALEELALGLADGLSHDQPGVLAKLLRGISIDTFLIVTDGSGANAKGSVFLEVCGEQSSVSF